MGIGVYNSKFFFSFFFVFFSLARLESGGDGTYNDLDIMSN
jgi:hypothetical protein